MFPHGETLVIQRRVEGTEDSHGNAVVTYVPRSPVRGCAFDPGGTVESFEPGRNPTITSPRVLSLLPVAAAPGDRAVIRGLTFEVEGDVAEYANPFTGFRGWVVNLKRVEG